MIVPSLAYRDLDDSTSSEKYREVASNRILPVVKILSLGMLTQCLQRLINDPKRYPGMPKADPLMLTVSPEAERVMQSRPPYDHSLARRRTASAGRRDNSRAIARIRKLA
jgi:hypothetical protein